MKVILLRDVAKIGRRFDVVNVPDGFALNKLIPKGLAESATGESLKRLQNISAKLQKDRTSEAVSFNEALTSLKDIEVPVEVEANPEGRMFQALKIEAIVEAVAKATGITLHSEQIVLEAPIKSLGEHKVTLVSGETKGEFVVNLIAKLK